MLPVDGRLYICVAGLMLRAEGWGLEIARGVRIGRWVEGFV